MSKPKTIKVEFEELPDVQRRASLEQAGVRLLEYIPSKTYVATIPSSLRPGNPALEGVRWIGQIGPEDKMSPRVRDGLFGPWTFREDGTVRLRVFFHRILTANTPIGRKREMF